ncbi:hypothetical protein D5086_018386 [Populus alba]|uniref:Uncharacterized protein n=1 Tax=Populus alba TaxID=43335 RepID=A0ACC4BR75_POPAL
MVLSRLAHGFSAKTLASRYSLEPYLVSKITNMVTRLLATKLYPEFIKIPVSRRRLIETTQAFEELTSLPNMCGAIDGSPIKAPGGSDDASHLRGSVLYNRLVSGDVVWDKVINVRGHHVRPYIVGDWCYPLLSFLMTPFSPNGSGTPAQNLFDGMLMKGREPEPETWKDPDEGGVPARGLENEKSFHYFGDSLRQALADDLHQRLSSR